MECYDTASYLSASEGTIWVLNPPRLLSLALSSTPPPPSQPSVLQNQFKDSPVCVVELVIGEEDSEGERDEIQREIESDHSNKGEEEGKGKEEEVGNAEKDWAMEEERRARKEEWEVKWKAQEREAKKFGYPVLQLDVNNEFSVEEVFNVLMEKKFGIVTEMIRSRNIKKAR